MAEIKDVANQVRTLIGRKFSGYFDGL